MNGYVAYNDDDDVDGSYGVTWLHAWRSAVVVMVPATITTMIAMIAMQWREQPGKKHDEANGK